MKIVTADYIFSILLLLIGHSVLLAIGIDAINWDDDQLNSHNSFYNASNAVLSHDWRKNPACLQELNAIRTGMNKHEPWATQSKAILYKIDPIFSSCMNFTRFFSL